MKLKYACFCEGTAEEVIMTKLLNAGYLIFSSHDLIPHRILRIRTPQNGRKFAERYLTHSGKIIIYYVHDSKRENFHIIPKLYMKAHCVGKKPINIYTSPEIESLLLISVGKYRKFVNNSQIQKPSDYASKLFKHHNIKSRKFNDRYWDADKIVRTLIKYKQMRGGKVRKYKSIIDLVKTNVIKDISKN